MTSEHKVLEKQGTDGGRSEPGWRWEKLRATLVWACTLLVFAPVFEYLTRRTLGSEQLKQAFLILAFAAVFLMRRSPLAARWDFEGPSRRHLFAAYALMGAAMLFREPLFALIACCFALSGMLLWVWGPPARRFTYALLAAFVVFMAALLAIDRLDWPLRLVAGSFSSEALNALGVGGQLQLVRGPSSVRLILTSGSGVFEVAPECNGFGLLSSCLLLSVLLVLQGRGRWFAKVAKVGISGALGIGFNILRIIGITLLAPLVGKGGYHVMHEAVGIAALVAGLGLVCALCKPERVGAATRCGASREIA